MSSKLVYVVCACGEGREVRDPQDDGSPRYCGLCQLEAAEYAEWAAYRLEEDERKLEEAL